MVLLILSLFMFRYALLGFQILYIFHIPFPKILHSQILHIFFYAMVSVNRFMSFLRKTLFDYQS